MVAYTWHSEESIEVPILCKLLARDVLSDLSYSGIWNDFKFWFLIIDYVPLLYTLVPRNLLSRPILVIRYLSYKIVTCTTRRLSTKQCFENGRVLYKTIVHILLIFCSSHWFCVTFGMDMIFTWSYACWLKVHEIGCVIGWQVHFELERTCVLPVRENPPPPPKSICVVPPCVFDINYSKSHLPKCRDHNHAIRWNYTKLHSFVPCLMCNLKQINRLPH